MKIKELRLKEGLTQKEAAENLGLLPSVYCRYENEARQIPYEVLIKIADYYGVTVDHILNHKTIDYSSLSDTEKELLVFFNQADERARQDAMSILKNHKK